MDTGVSEALSSLPGGSQGGISSILSENPQLREALGEAFRNIWKPALAGAAIGGGGAGYLASRDPGPEGESSGERRKRLLRSALLGAGLGGTAAAALPVAGALWKTPLGEGPGEPSIAGKLSDAAGSLGGKALGAVAPAAGGTVGATAGGLGASIPFWGGNRASTAEASKLVSDLTKNKAQGRVTPAGLDLLANKNRVQSKGWHPKDVRDLFREAGKVRGEGTTGRILESLNQSKLNPLRGRGGVKLRAPGAVQLPLLLAGALGGGSLGNAAQRAVLPSQE